MGYAGTTFKDVDIQRVRQALQNEWLKSTGKPYHSTPSLGATVRGYLRFLSVLLLVGLAATCAAVFCTGFALTSGLLITRWASASQVLYTRPIFFDYSRSRVEAKAIFSDAPLATSYEAVEQPGKTGPKFLRSGQVVDVRLELCMPRDAAFKYMFQVQSELQSIDGSRVARMSRAFRYMPPRRSIFSWFWPSWLFWHVTHHSFVLPLFDGYVEKADMPINVVRVAMLGRSGSDQVPEVLEAFVHIQLRLGYTGWLLQKIRPSFLSLALLLPVSLTATVTGAIFAVIALAATVVTLQSGHSETRVHKGSQGPLTGPASETSSTLLDEDVGSAEEDDTLNEGISDAYLAREASGFAGDETEGTVGQAPYAQHGQQYDGYESTVGDVTSLDEQQGGQGGWHYEPVQRENDTDAGSGRQSGGAMYGDEDGLIADDWRWRQAGAVNGALTPDQSEARTKEGRERHVSLGPSAERLRQRSVGKVAEVGFEGLERRQDFLGIGSFCRALGAMSNRKAQ